MFLLGLLSHRVRVSDRGGPIGPPRAQARDPIGQPQETCQGFRSHGSGNQGLLLARIGQMLTCLEPVWGKTDQSVMMSDEQQISTLPGLRAAGCPTPRGGPILGLGRGPGPLSQTWWGPVELETAAWSS